MVTYEIEKAKDEKKTAQRLQEYAKKVAKLQKGKGGKK